MRKESRLDIFLLTITITIQTDVCSHCVSNAGILFLFCIVCFHIDFSLLSSSFGKKIKILFWSFVGPGTFLFINAEDLFALLMISHI